MSIIFKGLSAFPITPLTDRDIDEAAFIHLITRLTNAGVDSIGAAGSTGSYPFMSRQERARVAQLAVKHAGETPVLVSIGAIRLRDVLQYAEDAQKAGVKALLLPPMSYMPLREEEVFALYETVSQNVSVPIIIYDTPGTTQFHFSDELTQRIARLPHISSIKIPSAFPTPDAALERLKRFREGGTPSSLTLGVSGDPTAAESLMAGAKIWYSEWGGLFPNLARALTDAAITHDKERVASIQKTFHPFWEMSHRYGGSLRVIASCAEIMGLTTQPCLPLPLQGVSEKDRETLAQLIKSHQPS
ncbi:dihydrodipicolinate synthase family protein [Saccharibacter sp. 17.LH.SD]|uniref:dihydrodipicolinate synthase family protein n=1 Tax=Saccharibacter sp. 17.LH.SD TaxID=2689393 RepID=UPI001369EE73|nr:dihydrodipicolinate synthase family protein [Saccharibacter sp. 17.LH.SD]MXV44432.1 dihydrodipicolinate synthase family protein [Saccharibacter sp. 17.LH.SD]